MTQRYFKYLLVLPGILTVLFVAVWPIFEAGRVSFMSWKLNRSNTPSPLWSLEHDGWENIAYLFDNFTYAFEDSLALNALYVTGVFSFFSVLFTVLVAICLALLLLKGGVLRGFTRSVLLLPFTMSPALVGISWRFMFNPDFGLFHALLAGFGEEASQTDWLGDEFLAMVVVIACDVWHWAPYITLLLIGGLAGVPKESLEAAKVDGANAARVFFDITLPLVLPVIGVAVVLKTIFSLKMFDQVYMLTNGGPGHSTQTLAHYIYAQGFKYYDMGYASALSYWLIIPLCLLAFVYVRMIFSKERL